MYVYETCLMGSLYSKSESPNPIKNRWLEPSPYPVCLLDNSLHSDVLKGNVSVDTCILLQL